MAGKSHLSKRLTPFIMKDLLTPVIMKVFQAHSLNFVNRLRFPLFYPVNHLILSHRFMGNLHPLSRTTINLDVSLVLEVYSLNC